jgi:hypothetical protein
MDYREFGEGITLYFGVNHPGALLFLGDGHAAQVTCPRKSLPGIIWKAP